MTTRTARRALAPGFSAHPLPSSVRLPWGRVVLGLVVLVLVLAITGCQTYPVAESAIRTGISVNAGHVKDAGLPPEAKTIAEKNGDLLWKVLFNIGGCEEKDIPAEVRARQAARAGSSE